jgi:[CysO sulfur-carrier protein]-S-L-cysteine hydrolase
MLQIPDRLLTAIITTAQTAYPLEICGLMAGLNGLVERVYHIDNRLASRQAYEMEPHQLVDAMLDMTDHGWELAAIFHSHPDGPAAPSAADIVQVNYPEAVQVIISLKQVQQPEVRAYTIVAGVVETVPWQRV